MVMLWWEIRSPAPEEEQPPAPVYAGGQPAGKQLCREGPGGPGAQQLEHERAACPGSKESQQPLHCQQVEGDTPCPLHSTGETPLDCWVRVWTPHYMGQAGDFFIQTLLLHR